MADPWESYFRILCSKLDNTRNYGQLLWQLHTTEFKVVVHLDDNRVADALEFRKTYFYASLDHPVTLLEVMVALAARLELDIMHGTSMRDRTSDWFWVMIESLGLINMTDEVYDEAVVAKVLRRFMRRRYSPNGKGGLFTIPNASTDMRKEQIWYQAAMYLSGVLRAEGFIES